MTQLSLAFYVGQGRIEDRLIRFATRSPYSHVELVEASGTQYVTYKTARAISSSQRDGGVREKRIHFGAGRWVFLPVGDWANIYAWERATAEIDRPYDYVGILFSQVFALHRQSNNKWFCSELCGHALGLTIPHTLSPGGLYHRVKEMNRAYKFGYVGEHISA
ncbi:MAG: hypothetical protein KAV87_43840 [Desulfobacteraceae bacterium]|nr:hypothetical protein [Desulfobacteraceae bacterium]